MASLFALREIIPMRVVTIGSSGRLLCRLLCRLLDNHCLIDSRCRLLNHRLLNNRNRLYDWLNYSRLSRNDNRSPRS